jgi:hypothetical protein
MSGRALQRILPRLSKIMDVAFYSWNCLSCPSIVTPRHGSGLAPDCHSTIPSNNNINLHHHRSFTKDTSHYVFVIRHKSYQIRLCRHFFRLLLSGSIHYRSDICLSSFSTAQAHTTTKATITTLIYSNFGLLRYRRTRLLPTTVISMRMGA